MYWFNFRGTLEYHKRRFVHNALCENIYPDVIVVPKSTEDVSEIIKITNEFNISISVRSGGHSYTCTSIRHGEILPIYPVNFLTFFLSPHLGWVEILFFTFFCLTSLNFSSAFFYENKSFSSLFFFHIDKLNHFFTVSFRICDQLKLIHYNGLLLNSFWTQKVSLQELHCNHIVIFF